MKKLFNFKKNRTVIIVMAAMVAVFALLHLIIDTLMHYVLENHMINTVQGIAVSTKHVIEFDIERYLEFVEAVKFEPERFSTAERLRIRYAAGDPLAAYYFEMNVHMAEIRESGKLAYVYVAIMTDEGIMYILDAAEIGCEEHWSAPGTEDNWDASIQQIYEGASVFSDGFLSETEWGDLIVAYAAVHDADGNVVGFVGADISGEYFYTYFNMIQFSLFAFYAVAVLVAFFILSYFSKKSQEANERIMLMLDTSPLCTQIWTKELQTIDCNEAAVRLYKFNDKAEYVARFLTECSAEIQPCGRRADEKAAALVNQAFDEGYCKFEWMHRIPDEDLTFPAEVTLVRAKYQERDVVIGYTRDLRDEYKIKAETQSSLEAILNSIDSYIYVSIPNTGELLFVNDCMKKAYNIQGDTIGQKCYKVFSGLDDICEYCPCKNLADNPGEKVVWKELDPIINRHFRREHCIIDWPDGQKVHLHHAIDITEMMKTQEFLRYSENLMGAVNQAAVLLLDYDAAYFENALLRSMITIAEAVNVDCVFIWKNHNVDGKLHCSQLYEWSKEKTIYDGNTTLYAYDKVFPGWKEALAGGECKNGPISGMAQEVQDFLAPCSVVSLLIVPIFQKDQFWGFIGFDDNKNERFFTEEEVSILNSASLLIASAFIHNDMIHEMLKTAEQLREHENLLQSVNRASEMLLNTRESEDMADMISTCMEYVGNSINADRIYIWESKLEEDGELVHTSSYSWDSEIAKEKPRVPAGTQISFKRDIGIVEWDKWFSDNEIVSATASTTIPAERTVLDMFDITAVTIIPMYLNENLWGIFCIGNCEMERIHTEEELAILRSVSLMLASAIERSKMLQNVQKTSEQLMQQEKLMKSVNEASALLLITQDDENINHLIPTCLELIGTSLGADRIYVWQSFMGAVCHHECIYGWSNELSKEKAPISGETRVSFADISLDWDKHLLLGKNISLSLSDAVSNELALFNNFGIKSVLLVPMFLDNKLWGILSIDNCSCERVHTEDEIAILRSVSLMMASAINRHELVEKRTRELATQTAMFTTLFDSIPDLLFTKDLDSRFMICNKALQEHFAKNMDELAGKHDGEVLGFSSEMIKQHKNVDNLVINERRLITVEEHVPHISGAFPLYETTKVPLIVGDEVVGIVGIARDITERKKLERKLADNYEYAGRLNDALALITNSPTISSGDLKSAADLITKEGSIALNVHNVGIWKIVGDNGGLESITYYTSALGEHSIQPFYDLTIERRKKYASLLQSERLIAMSNMEDCKKIFDGFGIYEPTNLLAALDAPIRIDGKLVGVVCVEQERCDEYPDGREWLIEEQNFASSLADLMALAISGFERRNARDAAERANHSKSAFIANISHEIRTPMNVIMGLTELLLEEGDTKSANTEEYLTKIHTSGSTLTSIINDILDISKMESGKFTLTPVDYQLASMLNDIATFNVIKIDEKPITFNLEIDDSLFAYLHGDDLRVRQILNNLLSNAFKYTKKGSVTLRVSCERENEEDVKLMISIADTGMGIRKEDVEQLFKDYHQVDEQANRKIEGTGLGLSITKRLAELMNGDIKVESVYGLGSLFTVELRQKYVSDELVSAETIENLREFRYEDKKAKAGGTLSRPDLSYAAVLVVDDFPTNLDVAKGMLGKYKMKIDCVMSGQDAINAIKAGKPVYDAIFMDHMMPGMDGIEAAERIRELGSDYAVNIPIIALTANAAVGNEEMFLSKGFQAFLSKPINVSKLDKAIRAWIMDESKTPDTPAPPAADAASPSERGTEPPSLREVPERRREKDEIPGINMKLGLSLYEDDMEMFTEILASYVENLPSELEKLHDVSEENLSDYAINIHTAKGAFAGIGAKELSLRAKEMEGMAKAGNLAGVSAVNEEFIKDAKTLIENAGKWLENR
jgi:PAS domain S-box-containing protein